MTTIAVALPRVGTRVRARAQARPRRLHLENSLMWLLAFAFYIAAAAYLVFHLHYMIDDAYARIDNAFNVLYTSDPHLAAIGFFWPPLISFLELPIIAFKGLWAPLVTQGFAGSIEAAAFSAGTMVLFNVGLRWAGVVRGMRWIICIIWMINPMTILFAIQGMSEAEFVFFFVASILVFLRWTESRRTSLLPLMGLLAGLDCLCRNEAFVLTFFLGVAVVVQCVRWGMRPREIETKALMFALPAILMIGLWLGSAAIIMHDPLYLLHANSDTHSANSVSRATAYGLIQLPTWASTFGFIFGNSIALFPAVIGFIALTAVRLIIKSGRVATVMLLVFGISIPTLDVYLMYRGGLAPSIRYQISVIPFTFLMAVWVLRSVRGRWSITSSWLALIMAVVLGLGNVLTAQTISRTDSGAFSEEAVAIAALTTGKPVDQATIAWYDAISIGPVLAPKVLALDRDGGRILCDSADCFPIVLNVPNAKQFLVTSDRTFEAAAAQPNVYGVEYFLVPTPQGLGAFDRLNVLYPTLYADGGGFSALVGTVDAGPAGSYRLYRITGSTGRG